MAVLLWQNPAVSALAFLCGCLTCLAIDFGVNGRHGLTFLTGMYSRWYHLQQSAKLTLNDNQLAYIGHVIIMVTTFNEYSRLLA